MALNALQYLLVLLRVTLCTRNIMVFELALVKEIKSNLMTGPAIMPGSIVGVGDEQRHMDRMTRQTGLESHVFCMLFMAIHAIGD